MLCKTDPDASPRHQGISILLVEHGEGLMVSRDLSKLGYKGVESCELSFEDYHAPADALLGGVEGTNEIRRDVIVGQLISRGELPRL